MVRFDFRVQGGGIPDEIRHRILSPFFSSRINEGRPGFVNRLWYMGDHNGKTTIDSKAEERQLSHSFSRPLAASLRGKTPPEQQLLETDPAAHFGVKS